MQMGFVCPDWALEHWNPNECVIERNTNNGFSIVDHSIQASVYNGKSYRECEEWLDSQSLLTRRETRDASQVVEKPYPIGTCPRYNKGDSPGVGYIEKLVYTEWVGGTCKAFEQVHLLQVKTSIVRVYHPGDLNNNLADCSRCELHSDDISYSLAKLHLPTAKRILTKDSKPMTWDEFAAMVFEDKLAKKGNFNGPPDRYDLLDLEED